MGSAFLVITLILAGLAVLSLAIFLYPYLIYPLVLRRLPQRPVAQAEVPVRLSLLFCAYNEAASLPEKLANLRALKQAHPTIEILAFDDGSADGTADLIAAQGDLVHLIRGGGRSGKACGMKQLAAAATGDILVFTDANVILDATALEKLVPYYGDPAVGGVCGTLVYSSDPGSATAEVGSLYWRLDEMLRGLESRTGNVMGADGSIFSIRRSLYPTFPDTVLDDFTVSMSVVFAGFRLIKAPDVIAYEKSVSRRDEELRRKIRIGARSYHTHAYLRPQLRQMKAIDRFKYTSRKLLRWFGGVFLALSGVLALAALASISFALAAAALALGAVVAAAALRMERGPLAKIGDAVLATFATLIGIIKGMRGQTMVTWAPAKSR
ncbi:glycosyltransferase [Porphyrobacter sp. LM 6]|uniref:glycosyltransferase n=1 Tax=Porphyrobacter sp. LM 6 TaxID=1896196 RepID=UPI0008474D50|nr:glycosyltransferase [Porphyrobacter sp. LM 6]AOL94448.1 Glycosyltransferase, cellulose synthase and poly-beta-1,6-N-acetylglucosamine synthase [Porphyrobacter sp. LM 6]